VIKTMMAWLGVVSMHFCMDALSFAWVFRSLDHHGDAL